jgi:hypothetical protein
MWENCVSRQFLEDSGEVGDEVVTYVAETVPLGAALGVEVVEVVVGDVFAYRFDFVLECLSSEGWRVWFVERETDNQSEPPCLYLLRQNSLHASQKTRLARHTPRSHNLLTLNRSKRCRRKSYFTEIISPVLISLLASSTLLGVKRFNLPR